MGRKLKRNVQTVAAFLTSAALILTPVFSVSVSAGYETTYSGSAVTATNMMLDIGTDDEFLSSGRRTGLKEAAAEGAPANGAGRTSLPEKAMCGMMQMQEESGGLPELTPEQIEAFAETEPSEPWEKGDTKQFESLRHQDRDIENEGFHPFEAECVAVGETCTIWVDTEIKESISETKIQSYVNALDERIFPALLTYFGSPENMDVDHDGKVAFVFYPMHDGAPLGFFMAGDLSPEAGINNNGMDMLHINTNTEENESLVRLTIAHELQHLINFARTEGNSELWLNEVFSECAQMLVGEEITNDNTPEAELVIQHTNSLDFGYTPPFVFEGNYVPPYPYSYGQWLLFGRYLAKQTKGYPGGGDFLYKTILDTFKSNGIIYPELEYGECTREALVQALRNMGYMEDIGAETLEDLVNNYNQALLIRSGSGFYSLTSDEAKPSFMDGLELSRIVPRFKEYVPEEIPGGGAASYAIVPDEAEVDGADENIWLARKELVQPAFPLEASNSWLPGQEISLSCEDMNADIYYTMDGSDPSDAANPGRYLYGQPITLTESVVLKICAYREDLGFYSPVADWNYTVTSDRVVSSLPEGKVEAGSRTELSCATEGASIYYTTDENDIFVENGKLYKEPVLIDRNMKIRAKSVMEDNPNILAGPVCTFSYKAADGTGDGYENNNTFEEASSVSFPSNIRGTLHKDTDVDVYTFTLTNTEKLSLTLTPPSTGSAALAIYDGDGNLLKKSAVAGAAQNIRGVTVQSGKYYVEVSQGEEKCPEDETYHLELRREMNEDAVKDLDLSEMNMLTAMTDRENSEIAWDGDVNSGGHFLKSMAYFSGWAGPVSENTDSYNDSLAEEEYQYKDYSDKALYHVQNALYMPNGYSGNREGVIQQLKQAVYAYGAADVYIHSAACYWNGGLDENGNGTYGEKNLYVDSDYLYQTGDDGGHIVTIVGWDDNYDKTQFCGNAYAAENDAINPKPAGEPMPVPENNGAFICKNSWGEGAGEDGYFYVSYEDANILRNNPTVFLADELPDNYNHQYFNDIKGAVGAMSADNSVTVSEVFTCDSDSPELLQAVSLHTASAGMHYEFFLRTKDKIQKIAEGSKKYAGFYTERLTNPVLLEPGEEFEIILALTSDSGERVSVYVTMNAEGETSGVPESSGRAFAYEQVFGGSGRVDLSEETIYPCIRAYTRDIQSAAYRETVLPGGGDRVSKDVNADGEMSAVTGLLEQPGAIVGGEVSASGARQVSLPYAQTAAVSDTVLPERFDLRDTGTMTGVRNQGKLGSCWTFAAIACLENNIARNGGYAVDYPESMKLNQSEMTVLLDKNQPEQAVSLMAEIVGAVNPSSSRINWSVTGDVDSVRMERTSSVSGEDAQILTAVKPGIVTVTAASEADMNIAASCRIIITKKVEELKVTPEKMKLSVGETKQITAEVTPEDASATVLYESNHPEIAYVDANGLVKGMSGGNAQITVRAGDKTAVVDVTVKGKAAEVPGGGSYTKTTTAGTGDSSNMILWFMMCLASVSAVIGKYAGKRQR